MNNFPKNKTLCGLYAYLEKIPMHHLREYRDLVALQSDDFQHRNYGKRVTKPRYDAYKKFRNSSLPLEFLRCVNAYTNVFKLGCSVCFFSEKSCMIHTYKTFGFHLEYSVLAQECSIKLINTKNDTVVVYQDDPAIGFVTSLFMTNPAGFATVETPVF